MDSLIIRPLEKSDQVGVLSVIAAAWAGDKPTINLAKLELADLELDRHNPDLKSRWLVAAADAVIVGCACWTPSNLASDMVDFTWSAVDPAWRGKGIATRLLDARISGVKEWLGGRTGYIQVRTWPVDIYLERDFKLGPIKTSKGKIVMSRQLVP